MTAAEQKLLERRAKKAEYMRNWRSRNRDKISDTNHKQWLKRKEMLRIAREMLATRNSNANN
ncbi:hypothetical protein [Desulfocucumis palustris]|nr:hypothetical protein [Desulfocucumis palustris]